MPYAKLTQKFIDGPKARAELGADRTIWWDKGMEGFGLQVTAGGAKSFVFQYRIGSISRRMKLDGKFLRVEAEREAKNRPTAPGTRSKPASPLDNAKAEAIAVKNAITGGRDPLTECRKEAGSVTNTFQVITEDYMKREGKKLRSHGERERILKKYIYPKFGSRQIDDIRRNDVVTLLDKIEDENGPVMADHVLAVLRKVLNWHAARSDEFNSPLVKGMTRAAPAKDRARTRILSDAELRAFWRAAEAFPGAYGYLPRFILLTATRRDEAAKMTRQEIDGSVWTVPEARHKSKKDFELPLSKAAAELLAAVPKIAGKPGWVFTHDGERAIGGFSKFKRAFDKAMLAELRKLDSKAKLPGWVIHDLRRTARSLMSRAGVLPKHAEMALGHAVAGVEGTYDRHRYLDEKRAAFEALAQQTERILNPQDNVIPMRGAEQTATAAN